MTKQEMKELIAGCAAKLGRVPSCFEVAKMGQVTRRQIRKHFGSYSAALRECDLESENRSGQRVPLDKLFIDWVAVVQTVKKAPSLSEYEMLSKYSVKPLVRCFGTWKQVPFGLKQYAEGVGLADEWSEVLELASGKKEDEERQWLSPVNGPSLNGLSPNCLPPNGPVSQFAAPAGPELRQVAPGGPTKRAVNWAGAAKRQRGPLNGPAYGPPMWPGPLAHSPVNELGVVFLFGAMAERMGFVVHRLQAEFPDCEAIRRVDGDKWEKVRIEFEYESRNFLKHMHEASECDLIVCWRDNWPESPVEVVELREALSKQRSVFS
jgi:hypothetical protein